MTRTTDLQDSDLRCSGFNEQYGEEGQRIFAGKIFNRDSGQSLIMGFRDLNAGFQVVVDSCLERNRNP